MQRTLFISYSHKENEAHEWLERLKAFLDGVQETLPLSVWSDEEIEPGEEWQRKIEAAIAQAGAAVLLVGRDFLASSFIKNEELPPLLRAHGAGTLRLYMLVVTHCLWEFSALGKYQAFNDPNRPLEGMKKPEQNRWLHNLCRKILEDAHSAATASQRGDANHSRGVPSEFATERASSEEVAPQPQSPRDLRGTIAAIQAQLDLTREAFDRQVPLRDSLYDAMRTRLNITEILEFEPFFLRYYHDMNEEEHATFDRIRALTEGPMQQGNREILRLVEATSDVRNELPIVAALKTHLVVWLDKYDRVFAKEKRMCLLYVGVEEGVPFPFGVDDMVSEWLASHATDGPA
jgi:hypothetical protein